VRTTKKTFALISKLALDKRFKRIKRKKKEAANKLKK
jgi:hypothetical protein